MALEGYSFKTPNLRNNLSILRSAVSYSCFYDGEPYRFREWRDPSKHTDTDYFTLSKGFYMFYLAYRVATLPKVIKNMYSL